MRVSLIRRYRRGSLPEKQALLIENTARNMEGVTANICERHAAHCYLADPDYGTRIAEAVGVSPARVIELSQMSHDERMKATMLA